MESRKMALMNLMCRAVRDTEQTRGHSKGRRGNLRSADTYTRRT